MSLAHMPYLVRALRVPGFAERVGMPMVARDRPVPPERFGDGAGEASGRLVLLDAHAGAGFLTLFTSDAASNGSWRREHFRRECRRE